MERITMDVFKEKYMGDVQALEIKTYVPISLKCATANTIMEKSIESDGKLVATYNSVTIEVMAKTTAVSLYTNLDAVTLEDYDYLAATGVMDEIFSRIGTDLNEYFRVVDLRKKDRIREANSLDQIVSRTCDVIGNASKSLMEELDKLNPEDVESILSLFK